MYPFADKEDVTFTRNPKAKDDFFGFQLASDNLTGHTYAKEVTDSVSSTTTKAFKTPESSHQRLCGVHITHIDNVPIFPTAHAKTQLQMLYQQFKKQQEHGMEKDFKFKITFSCEKNLQGKKLKRAIDNHLIPGTTKRTKSKPTKDDDGISTELDDWSTCFKLGFRVYKVFGYTEYKGKL